MTSVLIPVAGRHVKGKLLMPPSPPERAPALMFVHGWGGSQRRDIWKAKALVELGFVCLTFNLRGHAATKKDLARMSRVHHLDDVLAAYDFLVAQPCVDPERIGAIGSSYGAYLAALLSAERKLAWLVLRAPAIYKDEAFDRPKRELNLDPDLAAYRRTRLLPSGNRALAAVAGFEGDALVVESQEDSVIPPETVRNFADAFEGARSARHHVIRGADHALDRPSWRAEYGRVLKDWFAAQLAEASSPSRSS